MYRSVLRTRRQTLALLAGSAVTARAASADPEAGAAPFRYAGLDHVALSVDNVENSLRFYTRLFGSTVMKEKTNPRHYVKAGPDYIAIAPHGEGQNLAVIDHFCPGIDKFDAAAAKRVLDRIGVQYREAKGVGLFVPDPDGTLVQLWTQDSWSRLDQTATLISVPSPGEPLLQPSGMDHLLVNVSNPQKSTPFYEKVLGPVINPSSRPRRTWFSAGGGTRVGLAAVESGQRPGIDHFCFTAPFDRGTLSKAVEAGGGKIIKGDVEAGIDFLDLDGIHVQVLPPARA